VISQHDERGERKCDNKGEDNGTMTTSGLMMPSVPTVSRTIMPYVVPMP
jgi:hypothetical protein